LLLVVVLVLITEVVELVVFVHLLLLQAVAVL
jgi:hypothetical protein